MRFPEVYIGQRVDLTLIYLGRSTISSPKMPLLLATMDGTHGLQLVGLMKPGVTITAQGDDLFLSSLSDSRRRMRRWG
jgi:hypothetical protein